MVMPSVVSLDLDPASLSTRTTIHEVGAEANHSMTDQRHSNHRPQGNGIMKLFTLVNINHWLEFRVMEPQRSADSSSHGSGSQLELKQ